MIFLKHGPSRHFSIFFDRIGQSAFSLIEVVVAMSILSLGILGVMQMGLLASQNITSGNIVTQAVLHAQGELERIRAHGSLAELKEKFPGDPIKHGYFRVSYNFVDPLAEEIDDPVSINCETAAYDGSGSCLAEVRVSWMRGGSGRGGRGAGSAKDDVWGDGMRGGELGLTLVELMVALAIVSIITASLTKMFTTMAGGHTVRVTSADLQQSVRAVMDLISHEIRMAGYSSLSPGSFGVTMAGPQSFSFTVDWNGDGFITESHSGDPLIAQESDLISYRFDGDLNSLVRETAEDTPSQSSQSLLGGSGDLLRVKGLRFSYLDERGEETERVGDIRMVGIEITADLPAGIKGRQTRVYRTHVACRNLGL